MGIPVKIVDQAGLSEWLANDCCTGLFIHAKHTAAEREETVLCWLDGEDDDAFSWVCPSCGGLNFGRLGDEAVSGWNKPRWVNTGTRERPTLTPSLGCPTWRIGDCAGHYWLRDGELEQA